MPGSWLYIDTNFPVFTGEESTKEMMDTMLNYLHLMVEQLRYSLNNLDAGNFNQKALGELKKDTTKDLDETVTVLEAQISTLTAAVGSLQSTLNKTKKRVDDLEEAAATMEEELETIHVGLAVDNEGNVSLGVSGKDTELLGTVTVNGEPI